MCKHTSEQYMLCIHVHSSAQMLCLLYKERSLVLQVQAIGYMLVSLPTNSCVSVGCCATCLLCVLKLYQLQLMQVQVYKVEIEGVTLRRILLQCASTLASSTCCGVMYN
jgi:hypothetical protein